MFSNQNKWVHNDDDDDDNNKPSRTIGEEEEKEKKEGKRTGNNFCVRPVIYSFVKVRERREREDGIGRRRSAAGAVDTESICIACIVQSRQANQFSEKNPHSHSKKEKKNKSK